MNTRLLLGALVGLGVVGGVAFGLSHITPTTTPTGKTGTSTPTPSQQVTATPTGDARPVGIASGYAPVTFVDTGAVDYSHNPEGWDYAPVTVGHV